MYYILVHVHTFVRLPALHKSHSLTQQNPTRIYKLNEEFAFLHATKVCGARAPECEKQIM